MPVTNYILPPPSPKNKKYPYYNCISISSLQPCIICNIERFGTEMFVCVWALQYKYDNDNVIINVFRYNVAKMMQVNLFPPQAYYIFLILFLTYLFH